MDRRKSMGTVALVAAMLSLAPAWRAVAATIEGVQFAESFRAGNVDLRLHGTGLLRYLKVFKGYVAALYLPEGEKAEQAVVSGARRLELSYFWDIKGTDFATAGDKILADNVDRALVEQLRPRLERMNALYRDVKPGDRYALTYVPGVGTELSLNGTPLGTIEGEDFARAYFSIWFGEKPIDLALKRQLLRSSGS